jgi:DNA-binding CsgD family transcriptional regulator
VAADPETGVVIIRADGLIVYMNEANRRLWTPYGQPLMDYEGRTPHDLVPREFANHNMLTIQMCIEQRCCVLDRTIWRGKQLRSTISYLEPPPGEQPCVLSVSRHVPGDLEEIPPSERVVQMRGQVADLGPLAVLTARELEVLALIGQGLRIADIARKLNRSPKTIETHRVSIGRKLDIERCDRVTLAKMVFDAGLTIDDAKLLRTDKLKG